MAILLSPVLMNPKQPEFVLSTSNYTKKYYMKHNIAHFYQFTAEAHSMGVIPDACIDILFSKKNGYIVSRIAGTRFEKGDAFTDINSEYFGVRFMPGYNPFSQVIKLSELVNSEELFDSIINHYGRSEAFLEKLFFSENLDDKIAVFMDFFLSNTQSFMEDQHSLTYAIRHKILASNGDIRLSQLSDYTGYSERYLNKKIHEDFGMNPKNLIRFIRFQQSVNHLVETMDDFKGMNAALESGFYDQSHYIKEFKKLSGHTPTSYIENLNNHSYSQKLHVIK